MEVKRQEAEEAGGRRQQAGGDADERPKHGGSEGL